ncbi:hypothetical protein PGB90_008792 [Kerria lacca]
MTKKVTFFLLTIVLSLVLKKTYSAVSTATDFIEGEETNLTGAFTNGVKYLLNTVGEIFNGASKQVNSFVGAL